MVDKISGPSGPPEAAAAEGPARAEVEGAGATEGPARATEVATADAVARIAEDVAGGRISRDEAVERIIGETLGSDLVRAAPVEVRAEIAAALEALVATDPYLQSLVRGLSSAPSGEGS